GLFVFREFGFFIGSLRLGTGNFFIVDWGCASRVHDIGVVSRSGAGNWLVGRGSAHTGRRKALSGDHAHYFHHHESAEHGVLPPGAAPSSRAAYSAATAELVPALGGATSSRDP